MEANAAACYTQVDGQITIACIGGSYTKMPEVAMLKVCNFKTISHNRGMGVSAKELHAHCIVLALPEFISVHHQVASVEKIKGVTAKSWKSIKKSTALTLPSSCISVPEKIVFPTAGGDAAYM